MGREVSPYADLDLANGLVKDAEGQIVDIVVNPLDQSAVDEAFANGASQIYLRHMPLGFWVRMETYTAAPFVDILEDHDGSLTSDVTKGLVFIEARTSDTFKWPPVRHQYKVTRTGWPFSHGRVITTTACQGRTMREGVILDCGRHESGKSGKDDDDWWLDLYVMLSRATRIQDLLLLRAPGSEFLLRGPPSGLQQQLRRFAARTQTCRIEAKALAHELGFEEFMH